MTEDQIAAIISKHVGVIGGGPDGFEISGEDRAAEAIVSALRAVPGAEPEIVERARAALKVFGKIGRQPMPHEMAEARVSAALVEGYEAARAVVRLAPEPALWTLRNVDTGKLLSSYAIADGAVAQLRAIKNSSNYARFEAVPLYLRADDDAPAPGG